MATLVKHSRVVFTETIIPSIFCLHPNLTFNDYDYEMNDIIHISRAGEPANFFSGSGSSFFFSSGSGPLIFLLKRLKRIWLQEAKNMRLFAAPALDYLLSLVKYFFPPETTNVKLQQI